ncbi:MAG: hypothetical protein Q9157_000167 [Trypethelium eluteriae]
MSNPFDESTVPSGLDFRVPLVVFLARLRDFGNRFRWDGVNPMPEVGPLGANVEFSLRQGNEE